MIRALRGPGVRPGAGASIGAGVLGGSIFRTSAMCAALLSAGALAGCRNNLPYEGAFRVPIAAAVLQPEVGGPFAEPIGFVANAHGGQISQLALKQGRFLTDDPTVSFLRANPLATGGARVLNGIGVIAPSIREVTVWASDSAEGMLLRVPYLYDCEITPDRPECDGARPGAPVEQGAYWEPVSSPEGARMEDVRIKKGYTTTEQWTVTYDGEVWWVDGSRSGSQPQPAVTGERYSAEAHRIGFTIRGTASAGDAFVVRTENGLSEHDVGGTPLALEVAPDQSSIALVVHDRAADRPFVRWFDPEQRVVTAEVALPNDAWPHRLSWSEDGALLVADRDHAAVWEIAVGEVSAIEHPTPWPTLDVASLDGPDRRRLYVVPIDSGSLWLMDRDTDAIIDVNPGVEGDQGVDFTASVTGLAAIPRPYLMPEYTDDGIRVIGRSVAATLSSNRVVYVHEDTGCLVQDNLGPRTEPVTGGVSGASDYNISWGTSISGAPYLELEGASGRRVSINSCAGTAKSEQWRLVYDQLLQGWRVIGSLSGEQRELALEDQRYLSDYGEISFVVRAGSTPSRDGWTITFDVNAGAAEATGDADGDGAPEIALGVSADPTYFEYRVGLAGPIGDRQGAGWYPEDIRPLLLVPGASSNQVGRVDPPAGTPRRRGRARVAVGAGRAIADRSPAQRIPRRRRSRGGRLARRLPIR